QSHAITHEASYGIASWLRDGAKIVPEPDQTPVQNSSSKQSKESFAGLFVPAPPTDEELAAEISKSDDPVKWWSVQRMETKIAFAQAYAAEKLFTFMSEERLE